MTTASTAGTLREYFDIWASSPDTHAVLAFPGAPDDVANLRYYTNQEIHRFALAAARYYLKEGLGVAPTTSSIVGISAPGTLEWLATFMALTRLGYTVLCLSPNLSDDVLGRLLEKADCRVLVTEIASRDGGGSSASAVKTVSFVPRNALDQPPLKPDDLVRELEAIPVPNIAFIWHSSGSTGLPKLMPLSQSAAMPRLTSYIASPWGSSTIWIASAPYQSAGLTFALGALAKPCWSAIYNDRLPLSGERLAQFIAECRPQTTIYTPWALEAMANASSPDGMEILQTTPRVAVFGAACPRELGDRLVREGVNLSAGHAMSETSSLLTSAARMARDPEDREWDYMSPLPGLGGHLWFKPLSAVSNGSGEGTAKHDDNDDDLYELVVLKSLPNLAPVMSNSNDPPGSFYTGDVFVKHPTKDDCWKIVGRKDDQISMAFPPTVNAHDYETVVKAAVAADNGIEEVVLFGQGRKRLGILVFVEKSAGTERAKDAVWEVLQEKVNGKMKMGVHRDMIVAVRGEVPRTEKKNFMRAAVYQRCADAIDGAYSETNQTNGSV